MYPSKRLLNVVIAPASTTSDGSSFHILTTLWAKKLPLRFLLKPRNKVLACSISPQHPHITVSMTVLLNSLYTGIQFFSGSAKHCEYVTGSFFLYYTINERCQWSQQEKKPTNKEVQVTKTRRDMKKDKCIRKGKRLGCTSGIRQLWWNSSRHTP